MVGPQLDLMPGEKMVLHSHPHFWFFWKQVVGGIIVIVLLALTARASGFFADSMIWITIIVLVAVLANTAYQFAQWQTTRFAVTDQRVAYQSGFFRRKGVSIPLNRINNVNFEQTFIARILGNGIVTIESAGETGDSVFQNIPDPDEVRNLIFKQVDLYAETQANRDASAVARAMQAQQPPPVPQAVPPAAASVEERLAKLEGLHTSGVINEDEYTAKRREILDNL
jgi:uncharacterized membrane protein YdbT with pleckstrin-like domain